MVPSDSALATSYRLSVVTMSSSAAVWPQFSTTVASWTKEQLPRCLNFWLSEISWKVFTCLKTFVHLGPLWSTCHCLVGLHLTWPPTVSWSPTKVVVSCALPSQGHVSSDGPAAAMETDALLLQALGCGTVCQLIWDKLTLTLNSLNNSWRHFCLGIESAAHCGYC